MFVREIVNIKVRSSDGAKQYTKILGMLRRLTYISGFFWKALYVVPSAVRLKATCGDAQAPVLAHFCRGIAHNALEYAKIDISAQANRPSIGPFKS